MGFVLAVVGSRKVGRWVGGRGGWWEGGRHRTVILVITPLFCNV